MKDKSENIAFYTKIIFAESLEHFVTLSVYQLVHEHMSLGVC